MPLRDSRQTDLTEPDLSGEGINSGSHTYFFYHTRTWRVSPDEWSAQCRDHLRDNTNNERRDTSSTHPFILASRRWFWLPNDIRGPCGPKVSWHLSYRRGKTPKKPHPGNLSRPGIEPGPAAWQARMLPPVPQRWTRSIFTDQNAFQKSSSAIIVWRILSIDLQMSSVTLGIAVVKLCFERKSE